MLEKLDRACAIAEAAGTGVTLKAEELRWLLDELKNAYETADDANEEALWLNEKVVSLLDALEFAIEPLRNYFDAMSKSIELRKLIKDNPFPEYSIVQLDITKKAISLVEAAIAKAKGQAYENLE